MINMRVLVSLGWACLLAGVAALPQSEVNSTGASTRGLFGGHSTHHGSSAHSFQTGFGGLPFGGRPTGSGFGRSGFALVNPFAVNTHAQHGFGSGFGGGFGGGLRPQTSSCRYWCRTPEGKNYCCENNRERPRNPITALVTKPGFCPQVRTECPLRSHFGPQTCSSDGSCAGIDRCCFDRCLNRHVCKQPLAYQG